MQAVYKKYGWILIVSLLIGWVIAMPSHFQKGGVDPGVYFKIAFFVCIVSLLITLLFDCIRILERILISIPIALISLFVTTLFVMPVLVEMMYRDRTWLFWETKHRIFINGLYYGLNAILIFRLARIYLQIRGRKQLK